MARRWGHKKLRVGGAVGTTAATATSASAVVVAVFEAAPEFSPLQLLVRG